MTPSLDCMAVVVRGEIQSNFSVASDWWRGVRLSVVMLQQNVLVQPNSSGRRFKVLSVAM